MLPGTASEIQEEAEWLTLSPVDGFGELCRRTSLPAEPTDGGVLVYINRGRRLANLHTNPSWRHFLPRGHAVRISEITLSSANMCIFLVVFLTCSLYSILSPFLKQEASLYFKPWRPAPR